MGARPAEAAGPSLACTAKSPDSSRTRPILSAASHAEDDPGGARAKHRTALRPVPGRGARALFILAAGEPGVVGWRQGRIRTTPTAPGRPRMPPNRIRSPERSTAESSVTPNVGALRSRVQIVLTHVGSQCRTRSLSADAGRMSRRWISRGSCAARDGEEPRARPRKRYLT